MDNRLSVTSRILVAFASGLLIAVFFLPVWRIDLFAPQYPEGLTMNIWINGLSGEVDVINGLNHYIGMKHITEDMFPEFSFLPYVVGFFMLLGMLVAITGRRKFLFIYLVLTILGGGAALYDFYRWGYNYGHNLDPKAPIQVPGLSYQPPLLGHKRILNFDAYSFPDIAGWIVIGAGVLAFSVWFLEWYRQRKASSRNKTIRPVASLAALMIPFFLQSCSTNPEPFNYGKDNCYFCKMGIIDPKFGGEIITKKSKVYKFDDIVCMVNFLRSGEVTETRIARKLVINFDPGSHQEKNTFLETGKASFWVSPELRSPMGSNAAALPSEKAAHEKNKNKSGKVLSWETLVQTIP